MTKAIEFNGVEDFVNDSEGTHYKEDKRQFKYNLNDAKAKSKLLKGAKRIPFELVKNNGSLNLLFNVGSWNNVVLPSIRYWNEIKGDKTCRIGSSTVRISSVNVGMETGGKHVDTLIVFFINREKVTCHFYNTTMLILVNSHGYLNLVEEFLGPYFEAKIEMNEEDITRFNESALETLGGKRVQSKVKRSSVKYPCGRCNFAAKTLATLGKHNKNDHALSSSSYSQASSAVMPRHSTSNNSFAEEQNQGNQTSQSLTDDGIKMVEHKPEDISLKDLSIKPTKITFDEDVFK